MITRQSTSTTTTTSHWTPSLGTCDKAFKRRGVQMVSDGKRTWAVIGDRVNHFIPNPTFDPIIVPGCLDLLFRGEIPEGVDPASLMKVERLSEHPEYQKRDARVDGDGNARASRRCSCCRHSRAASRRRSRMTSTPRWRRSTRSTVAGRGLGFRPARSPDHLGTDHLAGRPGQGCRRGRIRVGRGAKLVLVRPAPVPGVVKPRSLGDPSHDPVWARLAEAGVPVGFHLSDSGYLHDRGDVGRQVDVRGIRHQGSPGSGAARRPRDPRHDGLDDRPRCLHPSSEAAGRQHRERLVLRPPADQAAQEGRQHGARTISPRIRSSSCGTTCGSPRTTRTICRCSPRPSASTRSCSGRTGRTARASQITGGLHRRHPHSRVQRGRYPEGHAGQRPRPARRQGHGNRVTATMTEWTIGEVLDAVADVIPDRTMTVCGESPHHVR